ncbi:hypothetical protein SHKM778_02260 [Streptomyces sp. KM77-8]|uniref:Aminotransferase class I/classII large domain-containing protein n=1 Tax=Streptomyces haneummycinicus TaxID=3074435 RepID=A0AAT9H995_9ACTN
MIALEPYYDSYAACVAMAGGTQVPVTLRPRDGRFHLDLDELRAAVTPAPACSSSTPRTTRRARSSPERN